MVVSHDCFSGGGSNSDCATLSFLAMSARSPVSPGCEAWKPRNLASGQNFSGRVAVVHVQGSAQRRQRLCASPGFQHPAWAGASLTWGGRWDSIDLLAKHRGSNENEINICTSASSRNLCKHGCGHLNACNGGTIYGSNATPQPDCGTVSTMHSVGRNI